MRTEVSFAHYAAQCMLSAVAGANQVFKEKPWRNMAAAKHNKERSSGESDARLARALKRDKVMAVPLALACYDCSSMILVCRGPRPEACML